MILFYILIAISQASFQGNQLTMSEFENFKNLDQNLLLFINKDDQQMVTLWNELYKLHADSTFMGFVDCEQSNDLCSLLKISQTPQLVYLDKIGKRLIHFDGQWDLDSIKDWLIKLLNYFEYHHNNDNNNNHLSQDYNNNYQYHHEDNHSENIEKLKYEELNQLYIINEQLSYKAEKFRRDIDLIKHQTNKLNTSFINQLNRQETSINFTLYIYISGMIAFVCVIITLKKINFLKKKQSILVQ